MTPKKSVADAAMDLAEAHRREDPATTEIYFVEASEEVRLVEVSGSVGTSGEVLPYRFGARPAEGIPYPSIIVLLSLDEWKQLQAGHLHLPEGWGTLDDLKRIA